LPRRNTPKELKESGWLRFAIWAMRQGFTVKDVEDNSMKWRIEIGIRKTQTQMAYALFYGAAGEQK
jgi:hypothetical protein